MKIWSLPKHETLKTSKRNIVEKRRNCSLVAISPLFHNIFNISLTSRVQLHIHFLNVVVQIFFSLILQIWYVEVRISRSLSESLGIRDNESRLYKPNKQWQEAKTKACTYYSSDWLQSFLFYSFYLFFLNTIFFLCNPWFHLLSIHPFVFTINRINIFYCYFTWKIYMYATCIYHKRTLLIKSLLQCSCTLWKEKRKWQKR